MCWTTSKKPVLKEAKEDIIVQKILTRNFRNGLVSLCYTGVNWTKEPHQKLNDLMLPLREGKIWIINVGLHSVKEITFLDDCFGYWVTRTGYMVLPSSSDDVIVECIIPKGAVYYINEHEEYVSSELIYTGKILRTCLA